MLLMKVCGCEHRGVSSTNATHVGKPLLANACGTAGAHCCHRQVMLNDDSTAFGGTAG